MANFDNDDPLAGLISDGSDDSFFEEPKKSSRKNSASKVTEKPLVSNLFDLNREETPKSKPKEDWLGVGETIAKKSNFEKRELGKKPSFEKDDLLSSLGIEKEEPKTDMDTNKLGASKKSSLMESLFGPPKREEKANFDDILQESKRTASKPETKEVNTPIQASRERRSRHLTTRQGIADPLGLFTTEEKTSEQTQISKHTEEVPKDLETEIILAPKSIDLQTKSLPSIKSVPDWLDGKESLVTAHKSDNIITARNQQEDKPLLESLVTQQKLATSQIALQNTSLALQQQENQLVVAVQLKNYEENLLGMQSKQQEMLLKQEQQFNSLLEAQFAKQQIMENNMRTQQERINSHIQMLLSQPGVTTERNEEVANLRKTNMEENSHLYEEIIKTLKERQHEEKFLLEESYKKQIALLEQSMNSIENQLKEDLSSITDQYKQSIEKIKEENAKEIEQYKEKVANLSNMQSQEVKLLRENSNRMVEEIRYEYNVMLENLKQIKQMENSALENVPKYTEQLDNNLHLLISNTNTLNDMRGKVEQDYKVLEEVKHQSIKVKEEELSRMKLALDKCREAAELERSQLMGLVRSLELKLMELRQNEKEERWALQQATSILAARSAAFDRETEFTRSSLQREQEQLKTLKETILAEQEKVMLQITEEKLAFVAEKSRLDTSSKLHQNFESQKAKAEMEAAMKVAQEATELADKERENLHLQQIEIESFKRSLIDREKKVMLREQNLEKSMREAERKQQDSDRALAEVRSLEDKYQYRLKEIQTQLVSLTNREKKLAEEKMLLSKERLALHSSARQTKRCGLCSSENRNEDLAENEFYRHSMIPDAPIVRLRQEIIEGNLDILSENLKDV